MRTWIRERGACALSAAVALGWVGGSARAQECERDADCGAGYVCYVYAGQSCSGRACRDGEACPPPVCETYQYGSCEGAPCTADADCPAPMLCHAESYEECDRVPACAAGENCATRSPSSCREVLGPATCREPYELPCRVDSDCGPGFRCTEDVVGWCTGSAGKDEAGDGGIVPPVCGEEPTGTFSCRLLELPCTSAADCPVGFVCEPEDTTVADCSTPKPRNDDGGAGDVPDQSCPPVSPPQSQCLPAHWGSGTGGGDSSTGVSKDAGLSQGGTSADAGSGGSRDTSAGGDNGGDPGSTSHGDDEEEPPASSGHPSHTHSRHGEWWFGGLRPGYGCALGEGADAEGLGTWLLVLSSVFGLSRRRLAARA